MSTFFAKAATSRLAVGPHSLLERNGVTFNDRSQLDCIWVDDFTGFGKADVRLAEEDNPQEDGATPYPSYYGGRTMTMSGLIRTGNYPMAIEFAGLLEDSLLDLIETPLLIRAAVGSPFFTPPQARIYCRPSDCQIEKKLKQSDKNGYFLRDFTVALRATNPRFTSVDWHSVEIFPTAVAALGRSYPRGYPLAYDTPMEPGGSPAASTGQATAHNDGNWPALPTIRFNGYMDGAVLINGANGHVIRLTGPVAEGDWIEINIATGTVRNSLGERANSMFDSTSDWMRLVANRGAAAGDSPLSLEVDDFGLGASAEIGWADTWMSA
jgi:hypothetical protein